MYLETEREVIGRTTSSKSYPICTTVRSTIEDDTAKCHWHWPLFSTALVNCWLLCIIEVVACDGDSDRENITSLRSIAMSIASNQARELPPNPEAPVQRSIPVTGQANIRGGSSRANVVAEEAIQQGEYRLFDEAAAEVTRLFLDFLHTL